RHLARSVRDGNGSELRRTDDDAGLSHDAAPGSAAASAVLSRWQRRDARRRRRALRAGTRPHLDAAGAERSHRIPEVPVMSLEGWPLGSSRSARESDAGETITGV